MIEGIHKHLLAELDRSNRSDTVFVGSSALFAAVVLLVTGSALLILLSSRRICLECHAALDRLYRDTGVSQYMPAGMIAIGNKRFVLSFILVASTGALAMMVPVASMHAN